MSIPRTLPCLAGLVLASCAATSPFRFGVGELQEQMDAQPPLFTDPEIAELEALAPQLPSPFRLGIAPPLSLELGGFEDWRGRGARRGGFGTWNAAEVAVIEDWGRRFQEAGIVSELVLMPRFLVRDPASGPAESLLPALRRAAALHHVDAVLIVNRASASQSHRGVLSILDLTIVGALIVPAYEVSSLAIAEGVLVDTRNGYVYTAVRGDGSAERHVAAIHTGEEMEEGRERASVRALEDMAEDLGERASLAFPGSPPAGP